MFIWVFPAAVQAREVQGDHAAVEGILHGLALIRGSLAMKYIVLNIYIYIHTCIYMYIYINLCMCRLNIYIYIYVYRYLMIYDDIGVGVS